jgi:hypothetical protein
MPFGDHRTLMLREASGILKNLRTGILHLIGTFPFRTVCGIQRILEYVKEALNELTDLLGWNTDLVLLNERPTQLVFQNLKLEIEVACDRILTVTNSDRLTTLITLRAELTSVIALLDIAIHNSYGGNGRPPPPDSIP